MQENPLEFRKNSVEALADENMQAAVGFVAFGFPLMRKMAIDIVPEFEDLREAGKAIKDHTLDHLDFYLEAFEEKVIASGGQVHWAATPEDARQAILEICQRRGAKTVTKGKSMVTEEIELNEFLEDNDLVPVETDLGEYIIQLDGQKPSHIIAPALHKTVPEVASLFKKHHAEALGSEPRPDDPESLVGEARTILRDSFVSADVGITGANFLIAETGSTVIVTNEGNGDLTQNQPPVHIVMASIEKVVPTLEDAATILRILARSATGQEMSVYTTFSTGPKRATDADGPEEFHVILLDNGRSRFLGTEFQEMLRCIKCGACMNHCPVYTKVGGYTYGSTYMGPMGSVITPNLMGIEKAWTLPMASTFCGQCASVCPMKIPLPDLLRKWRETAFEKNLPSATERYGLGLWVRYVRHPKVYQLLTKIAARFLAHWAGSRRLISWLPLASAWTDFRDMPAPQGDSFMSLYKQQQAEQKRAGVDK